MTTTDSDLKTYKYAGGRTGSHERYWAMTSGGAELPPEVARCYCGKRFLSNTSVRFIKHESGRLLQVGQGCCFRMLPDKHQHRTCKDCGASHSSRMVNQCVDCRPEYPSRDPANRRVLAGSDASEAETSESHAAMESFYTPMPSAFSQVKTMDSTFLSFLTSELFPSGPSRVSWSMSRLGDDDPRVFFTLFYAGKAQTTLTYDSDFNRIVRVKAQGGEAVQCHVDKHWERLNDTLNLMVSHLPTEED